MSARSSVQMVRLAGRRFVIMPESDYKALQNRPNTVVGRRRLSKQDLGDIAESKRRLNEPGRGVSLADVRKRLGV